MPAVKQGLPGQRDEPAGGLTLSPHWERRFDRYAPTNAGLTIQATKGLAKLPIGLWEGLAVLAAWAMVAMWLAGSC